MAKKVILTADSTCDIGEQLMQRYNVAALCPLHVTYDVNSFDDGVNINADDIYRRFAEDGTLPHTAAISVGEYEDFFRPFVESGCEVVHISLGSALSSSYANACIAAGMLEGVHVVDSQNLSTGSGLLVIEAAELIAKGVEAQTAAQAVRDMAERSHASFVLETLKFMAAGGRCSTVAALGANLLGIKPSIEVNSAAGGSMAVGKKYRGKYEKCVLDYVNDQLDRYDGFVRSERIFITHSGMTEQYAAIPEMIRSELKKRGTFSEIIETRAGCTISSHCGPNCIGILFMTK